MPQVRTADARRRTPWSAGLRLALQTRTAPEGCAAPYGVLRWVAPADVGHRRLSRPQDWEDVYVVTGPLYLPTKTNAGWSLVHPMIGHPPCMVAVPTHFFKVMCSHATVARSLRAHTTSLLATLGDNTQIPLIHQAL